MGGNLSKVVVDFYPDVLSILTRNSISPLRDLGLVYRINYFKNWIFHVADHRAAVVGA